MLKYFEKLQKCLEAKDIVEIMAKNETVITGVLSEVGIDYIAITHAVDRDLVETVEITEGDRKGETEEQHFTQVIELETILNIIDIHAISRILKKSVK